MDQDQNVVNPPFSLEVVERLRLCIVPPPQNTNVPFGWSIQTNFEGELDAMNEIGYGATLEEAWAMAMSVYNETEDVC